MTVAVGNAAATAARIDGSKLSKAEKRIPACGVSPPSDARHCSIAVAIASSGSTSSP